MKPLLSHANKLTATLPLIAAILPLLAVTAAAAQAEKEFVQILVKPKASMKEATLTSLLTVRGAKQQGTVAALNVRIIRVPAVGAAQLLTALQHHHDVEYAEPDFTAEALGTANDTYFTQGASGTFQKSRPRPPGTSPPAPPMSWSPSWTQGSAPPTRISSARC